MDSLIPREVADKEEREAALLWLKRSFAQRQYHTGNPYGNEMFEFKVDHSASCACEDGEDPCLLSGSVVYWNWDPGENLYYKHLCGVDIEAEERPQWIA